MDYPRVKCCAVRKTTGDFLWFGTDVGLVKYDGEQFTVFNANNCNMRGDRINYMAKDEQGLIWMFYSTGFSAFPGARLILLTLLIIRLKLSVTALKMCPFLKRQ